MPRKLLVAGILVLALAPSAYLAWMAREMPHFGHLHDDSIYWVSAKSLAEGRGYRILSLPGEPFQTKYPPLWPLMLAAVWRINPHFPENLKLAMAVTWVMLPAFLAVAWRWFRKAGFGEAAGAAMCSMLALSPSVIFFSTSVLSDLAFSALLLGTILVIEEAENRPGWAWGAGLLGTAAYLVKTAALPLLIAAPLWLVLRKKYRAAAAFFAAMAPGIAAWSWWTHEHMRHATDIVSLYYVNYVGYQLYCVGWRDLPLVMWKNLDGMLHGITGLLMSHISASLWGMHLSRLVAIGAIVGAVRLARRRGMSAYHWFAAGYAAILLVWHFPANERFMLPLFPLLLAGLATEIMHLVGILKKSWARGMAERAVAAGMVAGLVLVATVGVTLDVRALVYEFPDIIQQHRTMLASKVVAFQWLKDAPPGALYADDDVVAYLYTSRHAVSVPVFPIPYYREDRAGVMEPFRTMPAFMREQHLNYLLFTATDFYRELPSSERGEARAILTQQPAFERVYRSELCEVYRWKPGAALPFP